MYSIYIYTQINIYYIIIIYTQYGSKGLDMYTLNHLEVGSSETSSDVCDSRDSASSLESVVSLASVANGPW